MNVRVIRNPSREPAPLQMQSFVETARKMDGARFAARIEAEKTIAAARAEADAILERARTEGVQRGRLEGLAALLQLQREATEVAARATDLVVTATRAVAERALGSALATDDGLLQSWARQALAAFAGARRIKLHANPATLARLEGISGLELVTDAELPEFVLIARTELGEARIELGTQVEAFVQSIRDVLSAEVAKR